MRRRDKGKGRRKRERGNASCMILRKKRDGERKKGSEKKDHEEKINNIKKHG